MSDKIIGTAVLKPNNRLFVVHATESSGYVDITAIDVSESDNRPPKVWKIRREGNILHVSPSLHIFITPTVEFHKQRTIFHNEGQWSVPFIDYDWGPDDECGYEKCLSLNRDTAMFEWKQEWRKRHPEKA